MCPPLASGSSALLAPGSPGSPLLPLALPRAPRYLAGLEVLGQQRPPHLGGTTLRLIFAAQTAPSLSWRVPTLSFGRAAAYAATLPRNSVGTRQLKKRRGQSASEDQEERRHFAQGEERLAAGQGLQGRPAPGGPKGDKGDPGASALDPVPSGRTIHGAVGGDFHAFDATASDFGIDVTLPIPAANALGDDAVFVNVAGWQNAGGQTAPTTTDTDLGCTGNPANPTAPAGKVCIYVSGADHAVQPQRVLGAVRHGREPLRLQAQVGRLHRPVTRSSTRPGPTQRPNPG